MPASRHLEHFIRNAGAGIVIKRFSIWLALSLAMAVSAFGLTADEQMRFADGIYLRGFYESAVGEYLRLLRDYPDSEHVPSALYRTGESYRQMGNRAGADRFFKRLTDEFPASAPAARAVLRRAEMALLDDRASESIAMLTALLEGNPPGDVVAGATYYLGLSHLKAGNAKDADAAFSNLLQQHGDSPHASYAALELAGMHASDKKSETQMAAWFEKAVQSASTPSAKAEALYRWGDWAYRQGNYALAADVLQSLLVELPEERRAGDALLASAWSLYYLDRTAEALARAEQIVVRASDAETAASGTYLRANCLRKMNRDGEALQDYQSVVRLYPGTQFAVRAAYETMATHFKRGDYAKALSEAPPNPEPNQEPDVLWMRAESERLLGRFDAARGRYGELVERFPKASQAAPSLLRLGEMAREEGRLTDAADLFGRVAKDYPKDESVPEALKASALARLRAGDPQGSLSDWEALLKRKPDAETAAEASLQKAMVLIELRRTGEAMDELDALLKGRPEAAQVARTHYWRGVLLLDQEKWSAAEISLRTCLSAMPDAQTAALARLRLVVALQRQDRMDEAADQVDPLLADAGRVADNPALVEWVVRRRFDQGQFDRASAAANALAEGAREASWRQIGWYWAGASHFQMGNETGARTAYEKSVAEDAETREGAEAQLLLAGLELKAGHHEKAAERYEAAAAAASGDDALDLRVRAYFGLGEVAEAAGQTEQAARHFMSVAVLFDDPEWTPHSLFRAGQLFGKSSKPAERDAAWRELSERYPESSFARQLESGAP